ncbi:predicted protein [Chaetomium globosum CBS 148.51]|uniref:Uncharacterized protein n=1 Tax=Chaetomium globosum (strain ATCC 6205 / CBS 148.51 / DSM 1962 / NBRC 6347 / NRRL 1970) TaxID=306901 RepID=Q2GP32_CHAGB|nr:uncharacterized protein CHGG_10272 [Chaetomium globosum CBS 148.51]EAQ83868.1 predicted protein [Chaetomium globosum CBS 148.51]
MSAFLLQETTCPYPTFIYSSSSLSKPVNEPDQLNTETQCSKTPRKSFTISAACGQRRDLSPMGPMARARLFGFSESEPFNGLDKHRFDPHDPLQGSEAETFREYWAQRNKTQIARAVLKSKANLENPTKALINVEGEEEEEDACGEDTKIDENTRRRLEEARLNAQKNSQMTKDQKRH